LATCDAGGDFTYLGRADQQVKVDGFRIEPAEIEIALMGCEEIKEAVVTAPELPGIGRQLLAHVVRRDGQGDDPELANRLRAHLRRTLPDHMIPARFIA